MVEDTRLKSTVKNDFGDDVEENEVETLAQVPQHDNVRLPGSDVKAGELVLRQGDILDSLGGEIGTLAFVGRQEVSEVLFILRNLTVFRLKLFASPWLPSSVLEMKLLTYVMPKYNHTRMDSGAEYGILIDPRYKPRSKGWVTKFSTLELLPTSPCPPFSIIFYFSI